MISAIWTLIGQGDRKLSLNHTHTVHENLIIVTIKIQYIKVTVMHLSNEFIQEDSKTQ